jgi:hypothetical protein
MYHYFPINQRWFMDCLLKISNYMDGKWKSLIFVADGNFLRERE